MISKKWPGIHFKQSLLLTDNIFWSRNYVTIHRDIYRRECVEMMNWEWQRYAYRFILMHSALRGVFYCRWSCRFALHFVSRRFESWGSIFCATRAHFICALDWSFFWPARVFHWLRPEASTFLRQHYRNLPLLLSPLFLFLSISSEISMTHQKFTILEI